MSNPFAGVWRYRSFLNDPAPVGNDPAKLEAILFAEALWTIKDAAATVLDGELSFGPGNLIDLKGVVTQAKDGVAPHAHIVGKGRPGTSTEHLFYDYDGSLTESWPNVANQVPAITGSVIRVQPHDGEPAGLVASFIAVKAS